MRCEDFSGRLADELAGTLSDTERAEMRRHVSTCVACRNEIESLGDIWGMLGEIPAPAPDSRAMLARLNASIRREQELVREQEQTRRTPPQAWQWKYALAAGVAGVVLATGVFIGRASTPAPASPDVVALRDELRDLRHMVALSMLQQQSASERLKGVSWSRSLEGPGDEIVAALLDTLKQDANVNVRLASIDALKRFAERNDVRRAAVEALQTQRSPLVQMALIDFVVETQDREAAAALRHLSGDPQSDQTVRSRAVWGLQQLGA